MRYTNIGSAPAAAPIPEAPRGTLVSWQLSEMIDASAQVPGTLPDLSRLTWDSVHTEPEGFVLVNRYRRSPSIPVPSDQSREGM